MGFRIETSGAHWYFKELSPGKIFDSIL